MIKYRSLRMYTHYGLVLLVSTCIYIPDNVWQVKLIELQLNSLIHSLRTAWAKRGSSKVSSSSRPRNFGTPRCSRSLSCCPFTGSRHQCGGRSCHLAFSLVANTGGMKCIGITFLWCLIRPVSNPRYRSCILTQPSFWLYNISVFTPALGLVPSAQY